MLFEKECRVTLGLQCRKKQPSKKPASKQAGKIFFSKVISENTDIKNAFNRTQLEISCFMKSRKDSSP